jgi:putative transposase
MEAYVPGVSTRQVDDLVRSLGVDSGISRFEVSRICAELDREMEGFRTRQVDHVAFPYLFCDATYVKGRVRGRVVSRAVVVTGVTAVDNREVLGCNVGDSQDGAFWTAFLRSLRQRGLSGVRLVVSDHHLGLREASEKVYVGASWQPCRVHFICNALSGVQRQKAQMVAAAIKTFFVQPDRAHIHSQLEEVVDTLRPGFPQVTKLLDEAKADLSPSLTSRRRTGPRSRRRTPWGA